MFQRSVLLTASSQTNCSLKPYVQRMPEAYQTIVIDISSSGFASIYMPCSASQSETV